MINTSNMVTLRGGLTRDPEVREEHGLVKLSLGVDNAGREGGDTASGYFDIICWTRPNDFTANKFGDSINDYIKNGELVKGSRVEVLGKLVQDRYVDKDGNKRSSVNVVAENVLVVWAKVREGRKAEAASGAVAGSGATGSGDSPAYDPAPF